MIDDASIGGGQQHILWLAEHLDRNRFEVTVACEEQGYLVDELRRRNIAVHSLRMANRLSLRSLMECRKLLRALRPDIVHTHGGTAGFLGRISALLSRSKSVVHTYHGIHYLHYRNLLRRATFTLIDRILLLATDRLICVAQHDYNLGLRAGVVDPKKTSVIWNGIDVAKFASSRDVEISRPIVGTIGRLHLQKGHTYFLEAARMVLQDHPGAIFEIAGDGELKGELVMKARALGISGAVRFLGMRTDVPEILSHFSVFVLSSLWEGLPIVLLEAMAARIPIVSTHVDGVLEILTDQQDSLLVPPKDPRRLADAILALLRDPGKSRHLADKAFEIVSTKFNVQTMVKKTEEVNMEII